LEVCYRMSEENEKIWSWIQSGGNKLKVISNRKKGSIKVINEDGKIILHEKNLTSEQLKLIEENFIKRVCNKIKNVGNSFYRNKYDIIGE